MLNFLKFRRDPRPDRNDAFRNAYSRGYARGRYDAAQTTGDNAKHWSFADFLSADAEADASVRQILRTRARYEVANNSYAKGIVLTLANDAVGTGPRLQMLTDRDDLNRRVEHDWSRWEKAVRLAEKLRTLRMARCQDGEAFVLLANNPNLGDPSVTLDLQPIEADRVTEDRFNNDPNCIDGITLDAFGNPRSTGSRCKIKQHIQKNHAAHDRIPICVIHAESQKQTRNNRVNANQRKPRFKKNQQHGFGRLTEQLDGIARITIDMNQRAPSRWRQFASYLYNYLSKKIRVHSPNQKQQNKESRK